MPYPTPKLDTDTHEHVGSAPGNSIYMPTLFLFGVQGVVFQGDSSLALCIKDLTI